MAAEGITAPVLITDRTAWESLVLVTTSTWPPGVLCRSALSARLAIRRSASRGSPVAGAEARACGWRAAGPVRRIAGRAAPCWHG
jgi:hypothetical protein